MKFLIRHGSGMLTVFPVEPIRHWRGVSGPREAVATFKWGPPGRIRGTAKTVATPTLRASLAAYDHRTENPWIHLHDGSS